MQKAPQLCKNHIATSIKDTCCFSKTHQLFQQNTGLVEIQWGWAYDLEIWKRKSGTRLFDKTVFKVLIILHTSPCPTPLKAMPQKETVTEVTLLNLIGSDAGTVDIGNSSAGQNLHLSVPQFAHIRVIQRVDVNSQATSMKREFPSRRYGAITEATGVIGSHRALIITPKIVYQPNGGDGITVFVQLAEDVKQSRGYLFMAHHFTTTNMSLCITMKHAEIA